MKRMKLTLALFASLAVFGSVGAMVMHDGIEEIMEKGFKKGGLRHKISTEIDKDNPNWSDISKQAQELSKLCAALCKEKQPQGEADSWKKLTDSLAKNVSSLSEAAGKKDHAAAKTLIAKVNNSCKECHDAHRP